MLGVIVLPILFLDYLDYLFIYLSFNPNLFSINYFFPFLLANLK